MTFLTDAEIAVLKIALQVYLQDMTKTSGKMDRAADDPDKYAVVDAGHEHFAKARATATRIFDLLDEAETVEIKQPSDD